ncbi:MAG: asparagine synthase-related protein [Thermoprotei archaeon]|nr:asparagine synthase-related protein [Thermoprotei archaeon]
MKSCMGYAERVAEIVSREASRCECTLLSGGVDTSFIALVHPGKGGLTAFTVDLGGSDPIYASQVASKLKLKDHIVVKPSVEEFLKAVDWVLANFRTIDPVEVSADAVHYISMLKAKASGCKCILSGDGGDELFAGYTFLHRRDRESIAGWVMEKALEARLPTVDVGKLLGVKVVAPLYSVELRRKAPEIPVECLVGSGQGKLLLREYLKARGLEEVALRPKTPVNEGSGSLKTLEELSANLNPNDLNVIEGRLGFKPPSLPHAWLASRMLSLGVNPPDRDKRNPCPICGRPLRKNHCMFCGAYVSPEGVVFHYR